MLYYFWVDEIKVLWKCFFFNRIKTDQVSNSLLSSKFPIAGFGGRHHTIGWICCPQSLFIITFAKKFFKKNIFYCCCCAVFKKLYKNLCRNTLFAYDAPTSSRIAIVNCWLKQKLRQILSHELRWWWKFSLNFMLHFKVFPLLYFRRRKFLY